MLFYFISALACAALAAAEFRSTVIERAYIVLLSPKADPGVIGKRSVDHINNFHKRASSLDYTVRHEYAQTDAFVGVSIMVHGDAHDADIIKRLAGIAEVASVHKVYTVGVPILPNVPKIEDPFLSFKNPPALKAPVAPVATANLASTLQMGGVDKLHPLGMKGKGIKIGIIDTGIDHRHPALGAGFGPGKKVAGGYSFVLDDGTLSNSPDPLATCYGGGHGTHVAGIIGMEPTAGGFNITGVAPEASLWVYRALDCQGHGGSDTILAAMQRAQVDGVDLVSMSLGIGDQSFSGEIDPLAVITKTLTDANIAVIVANANSASGSKYANELYTAGWPATNPTAIGVGSVANSNFPLVYSTTDSKGATLKYASVYPLNFTNGADIYILDSGCNTDSWESALAEIGAANINKTIIAFEATQNCGVTSAGNWNASPVQPVIILAYNANNSDPYQSEYSAPSPGFYKSVQIVNLNAIDGQTFKANYDSAGGYKKYKLTFKISAFTSPPQVSGGFVDYYSSFGPTWHNYDLKPQISAPGGHILATYPLGVRGGYAILSGTSMATPYISGCYALVKSKFPSATWVQIRDILQTNSVPLPWIYDTSIVAATAQQGSGLVNAYDAIFSTSTVSPGQLKINDVTRTEYGTANLTIKNTSGKSKTYTLSHQGAGYMNYQHAYMEINQLPLYGTANFTQSSVTIQAGQSANVKFAVVPPKGVDATKLPVFGGFIKVSAPGGEDYTVPYIGPPYSQFNTPYIFIATAADGFPLPRVSGIGADGSGTVDVNFLNISSTNGYTTVISTSEWTQEFRADLLPANTKIVANNYGFNKSFTWNYIPSAVKPKTTIFGFESFGNLVNRTDYSGPGSYNPGATDSSVTGPDGVKYKVGSGDYRILASVLRWGGTKGKKDDYTTWLGPVMRFVN